MGDQQASKTVFSLPSTAIRAGQSFYGIMCADAIFCAAAPHGFSPIHRATYNAKREKVF